MEKIVNIIEKFDFILQKNNMPNYKKLNPPLIKNQVSQILENLKITDNNFIALYLWKNGSDLNKSLGNLCWIVKFGTIMPLEEVYETYVSNNTIDGRWDSPWLIPFITDTTGQYLLFNNEKGPNFGKIYLYSASLLDAIDTIIYYDSLKNLFQTTIEAYIMGSISYEPNGNLQINSTEYKKIATSLNPLSDYWKKK